MLRVCLLKRVRDVVLPYAEQTSCIQSLSDVQNWELVIDLTGFQDQPPAMFVERLFAVCPLSVIEGLRTVALFQPNFASFPTLKSIFILLTCSGKLLLVSQKYREPYVDTSNSCK